MTQLLGFDPAHRGFDPLLFSRVTNLKGGKTIIAKKNSPEVNLEKIKKLIFELKTYPQFLITYF